MSIAPVASPVLATLRVAASTRESPSPARRIAPARSRVVERVVVRSRAVPSDTIAASAMPADVPSLRLIYFDVMAKGLQVTMVAHHSGLSWEGKPEGFAWRDGPNAMKPKGVAPFGQLPLLCVGGDDVALEPGEVLEVAAREVVDDDDLGAVPARAINSNAGTSGAAFLKLGAGARAGGMAEAYSALADDIYSVYYNPAALTRLEKSELAAAHTEHFQDISYNFGAFAYPMGREEGRSKHVLAMAIYNLSISDIERRTEDTDNPTGTFGAGDFAYAISYARRLSERVSVGGNGKYIHQSIDNYQEIGRAHV